MPVSLPRLRRAALFAVPLLAIGLAACGGGGGDDDDIDMPVAFAVIGQADFAGYQSNRGSSVNALGLAQPLGGVATDGSKYYVADYSNHRILGWNSIPASGATTPDFVIGQSDFTSNSSGTAATKLALPSSVAITDTHLVVADSGNNRVLIWNTLPSANTAPDVVVGQSDFVTDDPGTTASNLSSPVSAMIANNKLFVADQYNNRVLIWNSIPTSNGTAADVVIGQTDFVSNTAADEEDGLTNPSGLWTDGLRLLVADSGNNRVMYWSSIPRANAVDATYVIGQTDFSRTSAGVGQAALRTPYGITSDGTHIYIADADNNRVVKFDSFPISNGASASDIYGQDSWSARTPNDDDQDGTADDEPSDRTLSSPTGVTYANGVLYVTDRNNHRVLYFPD
ncbi:NHL repeat-containing protein [Hydrocarboniphaga sp.]|uniref:NHL repeat-containing protein n=1 Tax=Hydrocarboniphaga sp. TaxID=2033016 RepID=UPI003D098422